MIAAIDHVGIRVRDADAAARFSVDAHDLAFGIGTVFVADPDGTVAAFVDPARGLFAEVGGEVG